MTREINIKIGILLIVILILGISVVLLTTSVLIKFITGVVTVIGNITAISLVNDWRRQNHGSSL